MATLEEQSNDADADPFTMLLPDFHVQEFWTDSTKVFSYTRGLGNVETNKSPQPILILLHGYPQSSYIWRHVIPLLPSSLPLFIPDLPGYGKSTPSHIAQDKQSTGKVILDALKWTLRGIVKSEQQQKIIIAGHDRGARICHRLAVDAQDYTTDFDIIGTLLLDIVPTVVQWESFADSKAAAGSFHWPFLANVELATSMISALGGPAWCSACCERWVGTSKTGQESFRANNAIEIYSKYFANHEVVKASCEDYRAGAEGDMRLQKWDQAQGKKIEVPTLVLYSESYLGVRYNMAEVWKVWVGLKGTLKIEGVGGDVGHFLAEEGPERTVNAILDFIDSVVKH